MKDSSSHLVLVVEDDPEIRAALNELLVEEGYKVAQAANGQEALNFLERGERPCVILLDLMMPVMDGWQFRAAQKKRPALEKIPVVIVTAAGLSAASSVDAQKILYKPLNLASVLEAVEEYCPGVQLITKPRD
jgi:CheY-like chemotaxis protein